MGVWMQKKLSEQQAQDVIYYNNGLVTELPRANVFIVKGNEVITPSENILHGITRKHILQLNIPGITIKEGVVSLQDLQEADEIFLTSSTRRVLPVTRLDGKETGNGKAGPVTAKIAEALENVIRAYIAEHT